MKKIIIPVLTISFLIALVAMISSWFIDYNPQTKSLINKALFTLLGALYIINGFSAEKNEHKIIFILCGIIIIFIGFIERTFSISLLGMVAILTPIIIRRLTVKALSE